MNKAKFLSLVLILFLLSACRVVRGSGNVVTETRSVSGFDRLSLSGQGELILTQGDQGSLEIEAEDNIIAVIESQVKGNTLEVGVRDNTTIRPTEPVRYYLAMPEIAALQVSGSGGITAETITTDRLRIEVSGSGEITIDSLSAASVSVDISGSGGVDVTGQVPSQVIVVSGSGKYLAEDLQSETVDAEVNGSGQVVVWASQTLTADVSGSGTISYYGSPAVNQNISGSGRVNGLGTH